MLTKTHLAILALLILAVLCTAVPCTAEEADEIEIDFMNGVYTDLDSDIEPVRRGALTIHISSPEHRLTVHANRLRLAANDDGTVDATLEVDFDGEGLIVVELESGAMRNKLDDRVTVPRQTVSVSGTARLEKVEEGYLMTVVDGPASVDLRIQSELASNLVGLCKVFEMIPFISVSCAGIETALSVVTAPMPGPGEQFLVPGDRLTDDEKAYFDRFVS